MASDLYETLGVSRDATPEQIRKAYKTSALKTHPDRHPNASPSEKAALEESFRKVSSAYEVLNDPQNRQIYDTHGVWPPPGAEEDYSRNRHHTGPDHRRRSSRRRHTFDDPSFDDRFNNPFFRPGFGFTDPFDLFERIFSREFDDFPRHRHSNSRHHRHDRHRAPSFRDDDPFQMSRHLHSELTDFMSGMHRDMHMGFSGFPPMHQLSGHGGGYSSKTYMYKSVDGATQTVQKTRDWDGNERVIKTYPDGRKIVTVNGVEQRDQDYLPSSSRHPPSSSRHIPPPPIMDQRYSNDHRLPQPPPYQPAGYTDYNYDRNRSGHTHRNTHAEPPVIPPPVILPHPPQQHMYDHYQRQKSDPYYQPPIPPGNESNKKKRWGLW